MHLQLLPGVLSLGPAFGKLSLSPWAATLTGSAEEFLQFA